MKPFALDPKFNMCSHFIQKSSGFILKAVPSLNGHWEHWAGANGLELQLWFMDRAKG